ncbi:MAG: hypothetical protein OJF55_001786 [Rhodanobacteraceae bacterium]|nr:MAG: hypothetical protein OJF55_001786 [Rhodanobacteraceae bacterium]
MATTFSRDSRTWCPSCRIRVHAFCSVAISSFPAGWLGGQYERMGNTNFWLTHAGLARLLNRIFSRTTAPA